MRYVQLPSQKEGWFHYRAVHPISGLPISSRTWATLMVSQQHDEMGGELTILLRSLPCWKGMLFECRGCVDDGSLTPFEFAVGPAPALERLDNADPWPFSEHLFPSIRDDERMYDDGESNGSALESDQKIGCIFRNLGGDAILVAPRPASTLLASCDRRFAHLASYMALTPVEEAGKLWALVATEYKRMLGRGAPGLSIDQWPWCCVSSFSIGSKAQVLQLSSILWAGYVTEETQA